jgi:CheY-like chemotaxis protein
VKTPRERVFVTDDDRAFRVATLTLLEDEGYEVGVAASGREALTELGRGEFDLVLSDMVMGEMSGIELLREIKKRWPGHHGDRVRLYSDRRGSNATRRGGLSDQAGE